MIAFDARKFAIAALCLVASVACSSGDRSAETHVARKAPLAVGDTAPHYAIASLKGDTVHVGGASDSVTLLNVWATWCESCKEEFAELERLRVAHGAQGLRVVGISVDQGSSDKVRRFVGAQGSSFSIAHDVAASVNTEYGVVGLPTTFLLGRNGRVRWTYTGNFRLDSAALENAINAAVNEPR